MDLNLMYLSLRRHFWQFFFTTKKMKMGSSPPCHCVLCAPQEEKKKENSTPLSLQVTITSLLLEKAKDNKKLLQHTHHFSHASHHQLL